VRRQDEVEAASRRLPNTRRDGASADDCRLPGSASILPAL